MRRLVTLSGVVGPTHYYGGLATGNQASQRHRHEVSSPHAAATQSLDRMMGLHQLGVLQLIVPPLALQPPFFSASAMWMANAATVTPSVDTRDGRVHITPASLLANPHRQLESAPMTHVLRDVFSDDRYFHVHDAFSIPDEGAANHIQLGEQWHQGLVYLGVYGGRQSEAAIRQVYASHGISNSSVVLAKQHDTAILNGVFHNDVIAVGTAGRLIVHAVSYADQKTVMTNLSNTYQRLYGAPLDIVTVSESQLSLSDAVSSYLFNAQLIYREGTYCLVVPTTVSKYPAAVQVMNDWISAGIIDRCYTVNLDQSMNNGGGPACLRLKLQLTDAEWDAIDHRYYFNESVYAFLKTYIDRYYPTTLDVNQIQDIGFQDEMKTCILGIQEWFKRP